MHFYTVKGHKNKLEHCAPGKNVRPLNASYAAERGKHLGRTGAGEARAPEKERREILRGGDEARRSCCDGGKEDGVEE